MKRTELGLIPLTYPMPSGRPPVVNRLGIFGAPSLAIGTVVCAISTIDTAGGWVPDGSGGIAPEKPPAGLKWWHVLVAARNNVIVGRITEDLTVVDRATGEVTVEKGVYTFSADDGAPPIIIERPRIGDAFILDALLGPRARSA